MNANLELERRLADFYASEAPQRAPDRLLESVLATSELTRQRRAVIGLPWRFPTMNSYAKFAMAAVAVIAISAVGLTALRGVTPPIAGDTVSPSPPPTPSVSSSPEPSRSLPPAGTVNRASTFVLPFVYSLPIDPHFEHGATNERYFELRVPEWAEEGRPGGLTVQAIGAGRVDPCDATSAPLTLDPNPESVFNYLATIPELTITDVSDTTLGDRPARQATVTATETAACPELHVWAEEGEAFITGTELRLIAVDVEGWPVVVTTYGEAYIPEWPALADYIVGSIHFSYFLPAPPP